MITRVAVPGGDPTRAPLRWTRADLEARPGWRVTLPATLVTAAGHRYRDHPDSPKEIAQLTELRALASAMRDNLLCGEGVVWLRSEGRLDLVAERVQRALFEALGRAMGRPIGTYGTVYDITDRGGAYRHQPIPISQTHAATGFPTDSSRRDTLPDLVGLHCLETAQTGGDSLLCSGLVAHDRLVAQHPSLGQQLYRPFVRDLVSPGAANDRASLLANRIPVFAPGEHPGGLDVRYMRYWIERGHERVGEPLTARDVAAFDALDALLHDPALVLPLRLARGDALWINNRTVLHNRTRYEDAADRPRRLLRMWLDCSP